MQKNLKKLILLIGKKFKENNLSLVTAESCTGGGLAFHISKQPEISAILERGFITYSNPAKQDLLYVKPGSLQTHGPVSKEVAVEMAKGALKNSQGQVSLAVTGIAGPDMVPQSENNEGIVWISCCDFLGYEVTKKKIIKGTRAVFIEKCIHESFKELKKYLSHLKK